MNAKQSEPRGHLLLLHGLWNKAWAMTPMSIYLGRQGWKCHTLNLWSKAGRLPLENTTDDLIEKTGANFYDGVICFSMGGLVARLAKKKHPVLWGSPALITLATPHLGTRVAELLPLEACKQMRINSAFLQSLNHEPGIDFEKSLWSSIHCLWTPFDTVVVPRSNARLPHCPSYRIMAPIHFLCLIWPPAWRICHQILSDQNKHRKANASPLYEKDRALDF